MKLGIVDYKVGNIRSVQNAFRRLSLPEPVLTNSPSVMRDCSGLILPGVGAFGACAENLVQSGLSDCLSELVITQRKPILGICVGMQLMANSSTEGGFHRGLGWMPGVVELIPNTCGLSVPHVGWNDVETVPNCELFSGQKEHHYYFDHSYHFVTDNRFVIASVNYGTKITVAVNKDNIFGVQFHPEKSAISGLKLLRQFARYVEQC